jgi:hypothetical protein
MVVIESIQSHRLQFRLLVGALFAFGVFHLWRHGYIISGWSKPLPWLYLGAYLFGGACASFVIISIKKPLAALAALTLVMPVYIFNHFAAGDYLFPTTAWIYDLVVKMPTLQPFDYYLGTGSQSVVYRPLGELALGTILKPIANRVSPYTLFATIRVMSLISTIASLILIISIYRVAVQERNHLGEAIAAFGGGLLSVELVGSFTHDRFGFMLGLLALYFVLLYRKRDRPLFLLLSIVPITMSLMAMTLISLWITVGIAFSLVLQWIEARKPNAREVIWMGAIGLITAFVFLRWHRVGLQSTHDVPRIVYDYVFTYVFGNSRPKQLGGVLLYVAFTGLCFAMAASKQYPRELRFLFQGALGWCLFTVVTVILGSFLNPFAEFILVWHRSFNLMVLCVVSFGLAAFAARRSLQTKWAILMVVAFAIAGFEVSRIDWFAQKVQAGSLTSIYQFTGGKLTPVLSQGDLADIRKVVPKGSTVVAGVETAGAALLQFWADVYTVSIWSDATVSLDPDELAVRQLAADQVLRRGQATGASKAGIMQRYGASYVIINKNVLAEIPRLEEESASFTKILDTDSLTIYKLVER